MKPNPIASERLEEAGVVAEQGYSAWKQRKIEAALAEAGNRAAMIPAEQVWRDLGLER